MLDQHTKTIARFGAVRTGPFKEALSCRPIHQIAGQAIGLEHCGWHGQCRLLKAAAAGVNDQVKGVAQNDFVGQAKGLTVNALNFSQAGVSCDKMNGFVNTSVSHPNAVRFFSQQGAQHARRQI